MVTDTRASLRDDGIASALARPQGQGSVVPAVASLGACVVIAAVAAMAGLQVVVVAALGTGIVVGTAAGRRSDRRWSWLVPPLLRALEYLAVLWAGLVVQDAGPATYAALSALAFRHYDLVYRGRTFGEQALDARVRRLLGGWQARTVVVVVAALAGIAAPVLWALAAVVAVLAVADTAATWRAGGGQLDAAVVAEEEEL